MRGPITDLTATLLTAWTMYGAGDTKGAIETIDKLQGPDWYAMFKDLHAGLILDIAGNKKEAGKRFERGLQARWRRRCAWLNPTAAGLSRNGSKDEALECVRGLRQASCRAIR